MLAYLTVSRGYVPGNPPIVFHTLWLDLLFYASPPAFGAFWALGTAPALWLVPFVLLYGAVPFIWGMRAGQWWRPGLAFGLGAVLAFPWVPAAAAIHWAEFARRDSSLFVAVALWLLVPVALAASALGARLASRLDTMHPDGAVRIRWVRGFGRWWGPAAWRTIGIGALLVLVGLSVWAGFGTAAWAGRPQPSPVQQLATAREHLNFALHLPTALPEGMALSEVQDQPLRCASPCIIFYSDAIFLYFRDASGRTVWLNESVPPDAPLLTATPPNYQVSQLGGGSISPIWWLGDDVHEYTQVTLRWSAGGITYELGSNDGYTVTQLRAIAASIQ